MARTRQYWKNCLWQSLCATGVIWLVLTLLSLEHAVIITSIGATAFIVFMKPHSPFAAPRNVIGGHLVGLAMGALISLIPHPSPQSAHLVYAAAVGAALFAMVVTATEHPPAAGTALSVAVSGASWKVAATVATSVLLLALFHELLQPHLRDL